MAVYTYPQVAVVEIDLSGIIQSFSSSVGACVGASHQGPFQDNLGNQKLVPINNTKQFNSLFGNGDPTWSYLHYTVVPALETMGTIYVSRVLGTGAAYGGLVVNKSGSGQPSTALSAGVGITVPLESFDFSSYVNGCFLITAENPGIWGNTIQVNVANVNSGAGTFDINVFQVISGVPILRESWVGCSRKKFNTDGSPNVDGYGNVRYLEGKINDYSAYIRVVDDANVSNAIMPVQFSANIPFTGGLEGSAVSESNVITIWQAYLSKDQAPINIMMNAGYCSGGSGSVQASMVSIATTRGDCFAILDIPSTQVQMSPSAMASTWRTGTANLNTNYAALYTPWIMVYDTYNDIQNLPVPPSGFIAQAYARTDANYGPQYAPAGLWGGGVGVLNSGLLPVQGLTAYYNTTDQGGLYSNQINYIRKIPGQGFVVWGQKTLQAVDSALSRVNVRRIIIVLEQAISFFLQSKVFVLNNIFNRLQIVGAIGSYLSGIQASNGCYSYNVVCDKTNNPSSVIAANQMIVDVYIQPEYAAEFIQLNVIIAPNSVNLQSFTIRSSNIPA